MAGLTMELPEGLPNMKSFDGVVKVQLPLHVSGFDVRNALIYPKGQAWMLMLPVTDELVGFVGQDTNFQGVKTYALVKMRPHKRTIEFKGNVAGQNW